MSRNAKKIRIRIANPPAGAKDTTSLEHARRYVRRGVAEWDGPLLRFVHRRASHPQPSDILIVLRAVPIKDSGMSGFLHYPMADSDGHYSTLARDGAGL